MCVCIWRAAGRGAAFGCLFALTYTVPLWDAMQCNGSQDLEKRISFSFPGNQLCRSEPRSRQTDFIFVSREPTLAGVHAMVRLT